MESVTQKEDPAYSDSDGFSFDERHALSTPSAVYIKRALCRLAGAPLWLLSVASFCGGSLPGGATCRDNLEQAKTVRAIRQSFGAIEEPRTTHQAATAAGRERLASRLVGLPQGRGAFRGKQAADRRPLVGNGSTSPWARPELFC